MEESIRVTAKTVEDAITEASIQLGTSRDNIEYTVLEKGTSGFFGIGGKKAVIEAKKKITDEDIMKEVFGEKKPKKEFKKEAKKEFKKEKKEVKEVKKESKKEFKEEKKASRPEEKPVRKEAKKEIRSEEKETKEVKEVNAVKAQPKEDAAEPETAKKEAAPKAPRVPADPAEVIRRAEEFLKNVFATMDMEVEIKASFEEDVLTVDLSGDNMGLLIGKRGQTLDSLQYLTSLVVNKGKASYVRVKLDTEDYRNRRKATLENLAKNIAFKVKKTRRPVFLEPMNPYERRIIHSALQNDPYVTTHSEGDEPCRKVVVTLRKKS
jgi:spoIIIJ-associated protein